MFFIRVEIYFLFSFLGLCISTQWVAASLKYARFLGDPIFIVGSYPIYKPWLFFAWLSRFSNHYPKAFGVQLLPLLVGMTLGLLVAFILSFMQKQKKHLTSHGSARWANNKDVKEGGLLSKDGVVLGLTEDRKNYLRHDGPEHVCVFAPTRSGKGIGLVVPTLLNWKHSVVCFDPKGENWHLTSGFRSQFSHAIYFDPTNPKSAKFNPLLEIRKGDNEVKDAQNVADMLVDPDGAKQQRDHWERTAHTLLVGAILHVLYAEEQKSLNGIALFLTNPKRTLQETLEVMLQTKHLSTGAHPTVVSIAKELLNKAPEELSGVFSTAMSFLSLYRDPIVAQVTSMSDFCISDLMSAKHPISLYLVVPPSDLTRTRGLLRLMLNQIGRLLTERLDFEGSSHKHRLLLLLDEFPALGKLDFFAASLAYIAGYGIKAFLINQSLNQIEAAYGPNNSILDNCHVRVAFASNDERTAKRISELLGQQTALKEQESISGNRLGLFLQNKSVSYQEYARPLLTPAEISQLPKDDEIIFVSGCPPIRSKKIKYYDDENFMKRVIKAPALADGVYKDKPEAQESSWLKETVKPIIAEPQEAKVETKSDSEIPQLESTPKPIQTDRLNISGASL